MTRNVWFWIVLILLILLLFGAKRLPDLASSVGKSLKIFKREISELQQEPPAPTPTHTPHPGVATQSTNTVQTDGAVPLHPTSPQTAPGGTGSGQTAPAGSPPEHDRRDTAGPAGSGGS